MNKSFSFSKMVVKLLLLLLHCMHSYFDYNKKVYKSQNLQDCTGATKNKSLIQNRLLLSHAARLPETLDVHLVFRDVPYLDTFSKSVLFGVTCDDAMLSLASQSLCVYFKKKKKKHTHTITVVIVAFSIGWVQHSVLQSQSLTWRLRGACNGKN